MAVHGNLILVVFAFISQDKVVWLRVDVEAVAIRPHEWLDDRREWHQAGLVEDCLGDLETIRGLIMGIRSLFFLLNLELFQVISFNFFEIVISAEH